MIVANIEVIRAVTLLIAVMIGAGLMSVFRYVHEKAEGKDSAQRYDLRKAKYYYIGGGLAFLYILAMDWNGINAAVESLDFRYLAMAIPDMSNSFANAVKNFGERNRQLRETTDMSAENVNRDNVADGYQDHDEENTTESPQSDGVDDEKDKGEERADDSCGDVDADDDDTDDVDDESDDSCSDADVDDDDTDDADDDDTDDADDDEADDSCGDADVDDDDTDDDDDDEPDVVTEGA